MMLQADIEIILTVHTANVYIQIHRDFIQYKPFAYLDNTDT